MNKQNLFWQTYLNLENELINISKYIYISDRKTGNSSSHQLETYSPYLADFLVKCCVEIEAISKELYFDNGGPKPRGSKDLYYDTDCLYYLNQLWNLDNKEVMVVCPLFDLNEEKNYKLKPLLKSGKRSKTIWSKSYQFVKHDRYNSLKYGNINSVIQGMAALYLLNIYNFNYRILTNYSEYRKLDMSFGSRIFSLPLPSENYVIDVFNGNEINEMLQSLNSPFILKYTDQTYREVLKLNNDEIERARTYLKEQKELNDPYFASKLIKILDNPSTNNFISVFQELFKFRINNEIPNTLPYETRKDLFLKSKWWSGKLRLCNHHKEQNEINEDNLQEEIDKAGKQMGLEVVSSLTKNKIINGLINSQCEMVLDKGNVKYNS